METENKYSEYCDEAKLAARVLEPYKLDEDDLTTVLQAIETAYRLFDAVCLRRDSICDFLAAEYPEIYKVLKEKNIIMNSEDDKNDN